ncbi:hypothetical protein AVEN_269298-1 [Araneus ventricosus]|uniref:Uncharacterized protein n=1 Tax=Araneus ventricosus TaxID=182803 RepID=A0A4Y2V5I4_ARAVE|nr:hypothetical protein AVEN_269298-1 [Araneus ventricosus]
MIANRQNFNNFADFMAAAIPGVLIECFFIKIGIRNVISEVYQKSDFHVSSGEKKELIGPVFCEGTLTGQRYLELLQDVITDFVENLPLHQIRNVWFQYYGAPAHKISNVKQYLMEAIQNPVIGYGGFVEWPSRSPDLTPLDFFLWGHIKGQVFCYPSATIAGSSTTTDACASVTPTMLHNVQREIQSIVQMCM